MPLVRLALPAKLEPPVQEKLVRQVRLVKLAQLAQLAKPVRRA